MLACSLQQYKAPHDCPEDVAVITFMLPEKQMRIFTLRNNVDISINNILSF